MSLNQGQSHKVAAKMGKGVCYKKALLMPLSKLHLAANTSHSIVSLLSNLVKCCHKRADKASFSAEQISTPLLNKSKQR